MPYTQEATMRVHYKKLSKFIRLADLLVADSRLNLIKASFNYLLKAIELDFNYGNKHSMGDNKIQACALFEVRLSIIGAKEAEEISL